MLFMLKVVSSFVRFSMQEGPQTQVWFLEIYSLVYSMQMNIKEFLNYCDASRNPDMDSFSSLFSSLYDETL